jgi:hypothetical protein
MPSMSPWRWLGGMGGGQGGTPMGGGGGGDADMGGGMPPGIGRYGYAR